MIMTNRNAGQATRRAEAARLALMTDAIARA
jgi:hypothetical protein